MKIIQLFSITVTFALFSFANSEQLVINRSIEFIPNSPSWTEYLLNPSDGSSDDIFGASIATNNGTTLVVGAPGDDSNKGSAYVFLRDGSGWTLEQKLLAIDGMPGDMFGGSIAIDGDNILVGAAGDDSGTGSAYVFERTGMGWVLRQKLNAPGSIAGDSFGVSVAIRGDMLVIGATDSSGSAYICTRNGTLWVFQQRLQASDGSAGDDFGISIAIGDSSTLVVGARRDDNSAGSAYVFARSGNAWNEYQKLIATDRRSSDFFASSVAFDNDTIVIGAFGHNTPLGTDAGTAYIFNRSGQFWIESQKLMASDGSVNDRFGTRVVIQGDSILVGAQMDDSPRIDQGSVYVFARSGSAWNQELRLVASDGMADDLFGYSVALTGSTVLVGAIYHNTIAGSNAGTVYSYDRECSACVSVSGRVTTPTGLGLRNATVSMIDDAGVRRVVTTSSFGIYSFNAVAVGRSYLLTVSSKRYRFASKTVPVQGTLAGVDFIGLE